MHTASIILMCIAFLGTFASAVWLILACIIPILTRVIFKDQNLIKAAKPILSLLLFMGLGILGALLALIFPDTSYRD